MQFYYIGINYKDAKLEIRDLVSFTDAKKIEFLEKAEALGVEQCMVLSTCNRSEVFFFADGADTGDMPGEEQPQAADRMCRLYQDMFPECALAAYIRRLEGREAMEYFFRITAGLESLVLGEDQILGQVRDAFEFSKTLGMTGKELNKVARDAVTMAKKIKSKLKISENPLSVSYIGIQMVDRMIGIRGKRALVIGSGKTAELAIRYLYEYGAGEVVVCSRTFAHAKELRQEFPGLVAVRYEERYQVLRRSQLVISATSAPHVVLRRSRIEELEKGKLSGRSTQTDTIGEAKRDDLIEKLYLDLATPRDIDPQIGNMAGTELIDLDTLEQIADDNQKERERLVDISRGWVTETAAETEKWIFGSGVDDTIESLQQRCEEIVEDTYAYLERKLHLEAREQKILKKMLRASLRRLLREPILGLKQLDSPEKQQEYQRVLRDLFQV